MPEILRFSVRDDHGMWHPVFEVDPASIEYKPDTLNPDTLQVAGAAIVGFELTGEKYGDRRWRAQRVDEKGQPIGHATEQHMRLPNIDDSGLTLRLLSDTTP